MAAFTEAAAAATAAHIRFGTESPCAAEYSVSKAYPRNIPAASSRKVKNPDMLFLLVAVTNEIDSDRGSDDRDAESECRTTEYPVRSCSDSNNQACARTDVRDCREWS